MLPMYVADMVRGTLSNIIIGIYIMFTLNSPASQYTGNMPPPRPIYSSVPYYSPSVVFSIGARSTRPRGMYIDLNSGKGCSSCSRH
jgi:hypothetical protein